MIGNDERKLGHILIAEPLLGSDADNLAPVERDECHLSMLIDRGEGGRLKRKQVWMSAKEAVVNARRREVLVKLGQCCCIARFNRPNEDSFSIPEHELTQREFSGRLSWQCGSGLATNCELTDVGMAQG